MRKPGWSPDACRIAKALNSDTAEILDVHYIIYPLGDFSCPHLSPSLAPFGPIRDLRVRAVVNEPVPTEAGPVSGVPARDPSFTVYKRTARSIRALALICLSVNAAIAQTATSRIASAANTFLSTLDQKQRGSVLFAFDDEKQRVRWSNFPTAVVPRAGLSMGELNAAERSAALALISSVLI